MLTRTFFLSSLLCLTLAAPQDLASKPRMHVAADWTSTTTVSATLSYTYTTTYMITEPTITATTTTSTSKPTYTATELYAIRPGAPFHMMPFQAAGNVFRLGSGNAAYCPTFAQRNGACEEQTNITGINHCSLVSAKGIMGTHDTYVTIVSCRSRWSGRLSSTRWRTQIYTTSFTIHRSRLHHLSSELYFCPRQ